MFISHMLVENYRTFRHVELHFDSRVNYIVGDNNIGKSNFLTLLKFITHGYGFKENDFLEPDKPIRVQITLSSEDDGLKDTAHLELRQHVQQVVPRLYNLDNGEELPLEYTRCLFYIDFALDEVPRKMISEEDIAKTISIFEGYLSGGPEVIEEVEIC